EDIVALRLRNDEPLAVVGEEGGSRHPVERLVASGVVVHEHRAVAFEDEQPYSFRQHGRDATGVRDLAAGDDETHAAQPTAPFGHVSVTDTETCPVQPRPTRASRSTVGSVSVSDTERPVRFSRVSVTDTEACPVQPRSMCQPPTIASVPSSKRTQAFPLPS